MDDLTNLSYKQKASLLYEAHLLLRDFIDAVLAHSLRVSDEDATDIHIHLRLFIEDLLTDSALRHLRSHYCCPFETLQDIDVLERVAYKESGKRKQVNGFQRKLTELIVRAKAPKTTDVEPYKAIFQCLRYWLEEHAKVDTRTNARTVYLIREGLSSIEHQELPDTGEGQSRVPPPSKMNQRGSPGLSKGRAPLTGKQERDYHKQEYLSRDRIHIPGSGRKKRSNLVLVNGKKARIPDHVFPLFLRLVVELMRKRGGWVSTETLDKDGIVPGPIEYRPYGHLRDALSRTLSRSVVDNLIDNRGDGSYRISTHPDFVTYDKAKLLEHPDEDVRKIAEQLPQLGGSRAGRL